MFAPFIFSFPDLKAEEANTKKARNLAEFVIRHPQVNATVFTVTNAVLFKGRPFIDRTDRILYVQSPKFVSYPDFQDWRAQAKSFEGMAAVSGLDGTILKA